MSADLPLPLIPEPQMRDAWAVRQQPSRLIAFWPGDTAPTQIETIAALQQHFDGELQQVDELDGALWNGVYRSPVADSPVIIWCDPAEPCQPGEMNDAVAEAAKWIIGIETMLTQPRWMDEYAAWLRALAGSLNATTILDPITHRYWQHLRLADLIHRSPAELSEDDLWTIHAIYPDAAHPSNGEQWLHTHGLWRCGRPELEMLEVPGQHARAAANLLNEVATFALYSALPEPGEPFEIGPDLALTVHRWQDVVQQLSSEASGGAEERSGEDNPHAGVRAVVCGGEPRGAFRKLWTWPQEAVRRFAQNDAIVYRSAEQSQRQTRLARSRWDDLAMVFAAIPAQLRDPNTCVVLIKSPLGDADRREHVWFEVMRISGNTAHGRLISQPRTISMQPGQIIEIARDAMSDWQVQTRAGRFGPDAVPALWRAVEHLRGGISP